MKTTVNLDKVLDLIREQQVRIEKAMARELYRSREVLAFEASAMSKLYDDIRRAANDE